VPSRVEIQCESAFNYMNAVSGENLTGVLSSMKSMRVRPQDIGGALRSVHRQSAFLPDDSDMHLGRERPRKPIPGP
jgi:hypothetical protein